jgi:hypothetical protein
MDFVDIPGSSQRALLVQSVGDSNPRIAGGATEATVASIRAALGNVLTGITDLESRLGDPLDAVVAAGSTGSVSSKLRRVSTDIDAILAQTQNFSESAWTNGSSIFIRTVIRSGAAQTVEWRSVTGTPLGLSAGVVAALRPFTSPLTTTSEDFVYVQNRLVPGAQRLHDLKVYNKATAARWVMVFDSAGLKADGSTGWKLIVPIAAQSIANFTLMKPLSFTSGIAIHLSTTDVSLLQDNVSNMTSTIVYEV